MPQKHRLITVMSSNMTSDLPVSGRVKTPSVWVRIKMNHLNQSTSLTCTFEFRLEHKYKEYEI